MSTAAATRRIPTRIAGLYLVEWVVLFSVLITHGWIYWRGVDIGGLVAIRSTLTFIGWQLAIQFFAGVCVRSVWALIRKERGYLRNILRVNWLVMSVRVLLVSTMIVHSYGWLKLMVPVLNPARYDEELWIIDRILFLGWSPNVLLLELMSNAVVFRIIDVAYGLAFWATLIITTAAFLSIQSERIRLAYMSGSAALWLVGVSLYVLIPSLGPAYSFPEVWNDVNLLFRESQHWQHELLKNYQLVLQIPHGKVDPRINLLFGVAAFPSLHVGLQMYVALWVGFVGSRAAGILFRLLVGVIFIGSIVTGWHYVIDGVAGIALAVSCFIVTRKVFHLDRWDRMRKRAAAAVSAGEPTPVHH